MSDIQSINTTSSELAIQPGKGTEVEPVSEKRQRLNELAQQLASVAERKRALVGKVNTMQRAKQAAQGDAAAARQQWSAKLRESDGTLTREIQKLRATERAALSLSEEYEAMQCEIAAELPHIEIELATVASSCIDAKAYITKEVAGQSYRQVLAGAGESLAVAFALFSLAENADLEALMKPDRDELESKFFTRLGHDLRQHLQGEVVAASVRACIALPVMDMQEVDMNLMRSPATRLRLQAQSTPVGRA
ncbi:hypothetical protein [Stenotrophomonas maltophilia]|uniref:hypothetical protein n=1 Tax=Stenotrophomonas maltophilia TaxID=40324 RepID=UPI0038C7772F